MTNFIFSCSYVSWKTENSGNKSKVKAQKTNRIYYIFISYHLHFCSFHVVWQKLTFTQIVLVIVFWHMLLMPLSMCYCGFIVSGDPSILADRIAEITYEFESHCFGKGVATTLQTWFLGIVQEEEQPKQWQYKQIQHDKVHETFLGNKGIVSSPLDIDHLLRLLKNGIN